LPDALDERVVSDGELLTSRGAGTALDFAFALVAHLAGLTKVEEVHEAMMA
jgi:4-methyl-5(b-hydroxyethyl)-thiazole monophosphate biosynthesis